MKRTDPVVENGIGKLLQYINMVILLICKDIINFINKMELSKKAMPFFTTGWKISTNISSYL